MASVLANTVKVMTLHGPAAMPRMMPITLQHNAAIRQLNCANRDNDLFIIARKYARAAAMGQQRVAIPSRAPELQQSADVRSTVMLSALRDDYFAPRYSAIRFSTTLLATISNKFQPPSIFTAAILRRCDTGDSRWRHQK